MADDTNLAKFAQRAMSGTAIATNAVANLGTDTPTNTVLAFTTGIKGGILTRLSAMPRGTVAASSLLLFTGDPADATKRYLKDSETMPVQNVTTAARIDETVFGNCSEARPFRLGPNTPVYVGSQVALAAGIAFSWEYSDFAVS